MENIEQNMKMRQEEFIKKYDAFLKGQNDVYQKFKNSEEKMFSEGLNQHPFASKGAYMVYFIHPSDVSGKVEELSRGISKITPSMIYSASNIHTTISDYDGPRLDFEPDKNILEKLSSGVKNASKSSRVLAITYNKVLTNQGATIFAGFPTEGIVETIYSVLDGVKSQNIELRMPWGAHMTASRTNTKVIDTCKILELLDYTETFNAKLFKESLRSEPTHIGVGHGIFNDDGSSFELVKFDEYRLR